MQKLNYPLKAYIKAVEKISQEKGFSHVKYKATKGSTFRFELFAKGESEPCCFWVVHHQHNKKKLIWSKEDYRKAARNLLVTFEQFIETIESV